MSFIQKFDLWSAEQQQAAREVAARISESELATVRYSFPDQHGILRGKTLVRDAVSGTFRNGLSIASSLLMKDTAHRTVISVFSQSNSTGLSEMRGSADMIMVPDPTTFRVLPWAPHSGWMLCDLYFRDGRPVPFATRHLCRDAMEALSARGYDFISGLEVEFHLTRLEDPRLAPSDAGQPAVPPTVSLAHRGYNYLTELNYDQLDPILDILRENIQELGLDLASLEIEFGPSQVEMVFNAGKGMRTADDMVLFRSAVKQVCRRHGYHASFMCRPQLPEVMSSGWHLHQSLNDRASGANAFIPPADGSSLSDLARHWVGGLLENAGAAAVFSTPTINGYKRYRPFSLAPDRAAWGVDNRGVMLRALCAPGDRASRIENRVGEPAANPYLYIASQVVAGMHGLAQRTEPGPATETPYDNQCPLLPQTLSAALDALERNAVFREAFGDLFIKYLIEIKRSEIRRYELEVSEWEQREYFDMF
ncbi:glutamine synthetase family protein [Gluconobacter wancherniae]|uniref:glutamine synthetase family protein n=1 Tax=Gluconobacter wancherniae TaxID=1307955 RepID=UPI001B8BCF43|nr:glutamine synthetase family protein [Gluconobacter wancherniae]MBS1089916.1 glutamine synthetase [Gluconobacter wancherniae]